jgi:hypothetical protein
VTILHPPGRDDPGVHGPAVPRYEIRVRGRVSEAALSSFEGMDAEEAPAETILHGPVTDQAGLHGLLDRIQSLGLELIEVRRLPPADRPT